MPMIVSDFIPKRLNSDVISDCEMQCFVTFKSKNTFKTKGMQHLKIIRNAKVQFHYVFIQNRERKNRLSWEHDLKITIGTSTVHKGIRLKTWEPTEL